MRIHPAFRISLLKPAPKNARIDEEVELDYEAQEYEVEQVLDRRQTDSGTEYLVE